MNLTLRVYCTAGSSIVLTGSLFLQPCLTLWQEVSAFYTHYIHWPRALPVTCVWILNCFIRLTITTLASKSWSAWYFSAGLRHWCLIEVMQCWPVVDSIKKSVIWPPLLRKRHGLQANQTSANPQPPLDLGQCIKEICKTWVSFLSGNGTES